MARRDITRGILSGKERMARVFSSQEQINSIIELGTKGYYPLFYPEWLGKYQKMQQKIKSNSFTRKFAKQTIQRLGKHKKLERKRTVLSSLNERELMVFINEFMIIVERKILNGRPEIH